MGSENLDKEWAAWHLGQLTFAIMGPALAMDNEPIPKKAEQDWKRISEHATAAAKRLNLDLDFKELLENKGSEAKHSILAKLLTQITKRVEASHEKPVADLVRLGNITAACMAYGINSKETDPIQLVFFEISSELGIPESSSRGFLDDPFRNLETFAVISVQRAKQLVSPKPPIHEIVEIKPGFLGITVDVKKITRHIFGWIKR